MQTRTARAHKARPVFPHGAMYRSAILGNINAQALARLHQGPDITIVVARPPRWASRRLAMLLGRRQRRCRCLERPAPQRRGRPQPGL
jgi:hypothetical protein